MSHPVALSPQALARCALGGLVVVLTCLVLPARVARADVALGADLDFGEGVLGRDANLGAGFAARLGSQYDLPLLTLGFEGLVSHHEFGGNDDVGVTRGLFGARLRVGTLIAPGVFGHLGVGHLSGTDAFTAPAVDAGLSLDLTLLPLVDIGAHAAYNVLLGNDNHRCYAFYTLGLHAALVF